MKSSNVRKSAYNLITSVLSQALTLALGIIIPRLVLINLGSEANGLLTSVSQALAYAGLLEVGVGMAALQALYKPVALNKKDEVNAIMSATHLYYRRTGFLYLFAVIILSFVYPFFVSTTISKFTVMAVMFLSGLPGVINYLFQGKFKILLQAEGKNYIITNLSTIISTATSLGKIVLLLLGFGVIAVQVLYLFLSLLQMLYITLYMKKHYKWLNLKMDPAFDKIAQSKSVFVHQVSGMVYSNTDSVVLSVFCGLNVASVYSTYMLVFNMVGTLLSNIGASVTFVLGQKINTDEDGYVPMSNAFEAVYISLSFAITFVAMTFITPFLKLYTIGITDINYIDKYLPFLFSAVSLLENSRLSSAKTIHIAGHFKQTQWQAIVEMVINIVVSISCVIKFGIYGVLFGTIAALFFRANAMIIYSNKKILHKSVTSTYLIWFTNLTVYVLLTIASTHILPLFSTDSYISIILFAGAYAIFVFPIFLTSSFLVNPRAFKYVRIRVKSFIKDSKK